ncbi:hypothetical protein CPC08DRAFT_712624 [Agrocybe pediades]|nr:hypothetical protein CPC08DRAFT_712624 [Agrocybe pediades]
MDSSAAYHHQTRHVPTHKRRDLPPPKPDFGFARCPESTYYVKEGSDISWARRMRLFWWRKRILIESTFALTVYEPWEKVVVLTIFGILFAAMCVVVFSYLPRQLVVMRRRSIYYLWGSEDFGNMGNSQNISRTAYNLGLDGQR